MMMMGWDWIIMNSFQTLHSYHFIRILFIFRVFILCEYHNDEIFNDAPLFHGLSISFHPFNKFFNFRSFTIENVLMFGMSE